MRILTVSSLIFCAATLAAVAQPDQEQSSADRTQADAMQRELEAKAVRIPRNGLAAALAAPSDGRSDKETTRRYRPDWDAVRDDIERTAVEDRESETAPDDTGTTTGEIRRLAGPPQPRPGLRERRPEQMQRIARGEVDRVSIPVLAPAAPEVRDNLKMYGQENSFTASGVIDDGAMVSISGACDRVTGGAPTVREFRRRLAEAPPRLTGMRAPYYISRNEFGTDLSFSKFGCGYVISIECLDPDTDERCTGDDYIKELAQSMWVLNAKRGEESQ